MVNLIKNHWQGKQSLVKSFWIYFFLLIIFTSILTDFIHNLIDNIYQVNAEDIFDTVADKSLYLFFILLIYTILDLAILIWAIVGTWRSATNYNKIKKNKVPWGTLTKIFFVIYGGWALTEFWVFPL
tara:strand:- start:60 stop:440 length:381 start_codon:yes stop_codon:yes gene_type:complete